MAFDNSTRNRLQRLVSDCRDLLTREFDAKLQELYGIYAGEGRVLDLDRLPHLDDEKRRVATLLRERINHLASGGGGTPAATGEAVRRVLREQAFTVLNRFAALRMAEERGIIVESVGGGLNSKGFKTFSEVAYSGLGSAYERYRVFLGCMFDEMATDLGVLFDRRSPYGLLFPREDVLLELFELLNAPEVKPLWKADETVGWIYQYFNDPSERKKMREESAAPRNSRELAVRNQFFTPRYVVEFLTDNTLGRIWYEMLKGQTKLKDQCRYLVRRPNEYFLHDSTRYVENVRPDLLAKGLAGLPEDPTWEELQAVALCLDDLPSRLCPELGLGECHEFGERKRREFESSGRYEGTFFELFCCLYFEQRDAKWSGQGDQHPERRVNRAKAIYQAMRAKLGGENSNLTQEDLLKQPVFIPHRPIKDPREIRMLDPACGSMHFGLYAFDLFEVIYEEYWDLTTDGGGNLTALSPASGVEDRNALKPLAELYPDKQAFLRDVPRLIIEHNLHGIDIDPRCVQIAGLSLWLRAQKAWQRLGLKPTERPAIKRSNIVCAEPMPGEKELLREFVEREFPTEERGVFLRLLETIFDKMQLAGEAGSLLKIEEEIRSAIAEAKQLWKEEPKLEQSKLFSEAARVEQKETKLDLSGITDEQFWERVEERIYAALREYAEQAENGGGFQRRLFAEDAARGFAFIDVCRNRYEVALMNPPFGLTQGKLYEYLNENYPVSFIDLLASFVVRVNTLAPSGFIGAITSRACLYTKTLLEWRKSYLSGRISALADMGIGVLDGAMVRACAYVIPVAPTQVDGCFVDARRAEDKDGCILAGLRGLSSGAATDLPVYSCDTAFFDLIPQHRILYWLPRHFWQRVKELPPIEPSGATIRAGLTTYDDERFLRLRWEVPPHAFYAGDWVYLSKGGYFGTFYNDVHLVVLWSDGGKEVGAHNRALYETDAQSRRGSAFYLRAAATYSRRTDFFSARALPSNCFFADKGPAIIPLGATSPAYLLGLFNSDLFRGLVHSQSQGGCFETGVLKLLPWIEPPPSVKVEVENHAVTAWRSKAAFFGLLEIDTYFCRPFPSGVVSLGEIRLATHEGINAANASSTSSGAAISAAVSNHFGLSSERFEDLDVFEDDHEIKEARAVVEDVTELLHSLVSYGLGCAVGRWDVRYAMGEKAASELLDPFAPLPVCPPGQLQNAQGLPVDKAESRKLKADGYPIEIPWNGILVDDPGHPLDIERLVREVIEVIWGRDAAPLPREKEPQGTPPEAIEREACEILGVKSLREYFRKPAGFFADHLKRYSKSRRQAPIYWPLSTASGNYTLWIYCHRLTDQTLFQCVNDFVKPKIAEVEGDLARLQKAEGRGQRGREELERLTVLRAELVEFRDELLRVAQLPYKPNLNDGVLITASPLWKLFRLPKWQKDLNACWTALEKGEYDWAHLAYTLWPERVKAVCTKDRSIAIAHALEDSCAVKAPEKKAKKGKPRKTQMDLEAVE